MIRVVCGCGRVFKAEERHSGKRTRCPVCGAGLIIGQTPVSSSSEGDLDEVPSWWYPSDPQGPFGSVEPLQVGSGDPDSVRTAVIPSVPEHGPEVGRKDASGREALGDGPRPSRPRGPAALGPDGGRGGVGRAGPGGAGLDARGLPRPGERPPGAGPAARAMAAGARRARAPGIARDRGGGLDRPRTDGRPRGPPAATARPRLHLPGRRRPQAMASPDGRRGQGGPHRHRQPRLRARHRAQRRLCRGHRRGRRPRASSWSAISTPSTPTAPRPRSRATSTPGSASIPGSPASSSTSSPADAGHTAYFADIGAHARSKLRDAMVITNPGVPCDEAYLARHASDVICVFSNSRASARSRSRPTSRATTLPIMPPWCTRSRTPRP